MTQATLAANLNVSDKAICKWETGLGYPEIGMLSNIFSISKAVGGCVPNTAIDLAKIDSSIPLSAIGCVGDDEYGRYVTSRLQRRNIDTGKVRVTDAAPTSFSDVMSMLSGERTFFHARGANALFSPEDVDIPALTCNMFHIGYILLLDKFDEEDPEYGTAMARFLHEVQSADIKTSIDVVSSSSADYGKHIIPALRYCDYVIINEIECCGIWNLEPRNEDGTLNVDMIRLSMEKTMDANKVLEGMLKAELTEQELALPSTPWRRQKTGRRTALCQYPHGKCYRILA